MSANTKPLTLVELITKQETAGGLTAAERETFLHLLRRVIND